MAQDKKSFLLYTDYINSIEELTDDEAGKLLKHLFRYVNDKEPVLEDRLLKLVFEPIKQQLKRDLKDWENTRTKKSESGRIGNLKRWNPDLWKKVVKYEITLEDAENIALNRKTSQCDISVANIAVNDTVTVTVNDTVTVTESKEILPAPGKIETVKTEEEEEEPAPPAKNFLPPNLKGSNLYREPVIPAFEEVCMNFLQNGGTEQMARSFYDKNESTGWFNRGSPIINFKNLTYSYIENWNKNEKNGTKAAIRQTGRAVEFGKL